MTMQRGHDVKVRIEGSVYSVAEYMCDDGAPSVDVSNSEGVSGSGLTPANPEYKSVVGQQRQMRVTLRQASFDPDSNPFAAPLAFETNTYIGPVLIYPAGLAETPITITTLYIERLSVGGQVNQAQPVTLEGVSDGAFNWPES